MANIAKKALITAVLLLLAVPLCAEETGVSVKNKEYITFADWLNARPYTIHMDKKQERKKLREYWRRILGLDIFYAYFKAREMKVKVQERSKIKIMRLRGKAKIKEDEAKFTFSIKF